MEHLPKDRPNHLLGIGDLPSIHRSIPLGIDTFDSSYPTKVARHGILLTREGPLNVTKGECAFKISPPEEGCPCPTCRQFSLSYLHHLFKAHEPISLTLATVHNLFFMVDLMRRYRESIFLDEI